QGYRGAALGGALGAAAEPVMAAGGALARKVMGGVRAPAGTEQIVSQADEFAIPLSRGQATGDITQQAWEEAARNNAKGPAAGNIVRRFDDQQAEAIQAAKGAISDRLGGQAPETLAQGG